MNAKTKALSEEARKLTPEERIELIEDLQRSLEPTDPEIDRLWAEEAKDRLAAYLRGEMEARTLDEIVQEYRRSSLLQLASHHWGLEALRVGAAKSWKRKRSRWRWKPWPWRMKVSTSSR